jgi:hypothetical protein
MLTLIGGLCCVGSINPIGVLSLISLLTINGQDIPFVTHVKYLGVIFDRKITWGLHIKTIEVKAFRAFIRAYSLLKSEHLT